MSLRLRDKMSRPTEISTNSGWAGHFVPQEHITQKIIAITLTTQISEISVIRG